MLADYINGLDQILAIAWRLTALVILVNVALSVICNMVKP